jgi:hypothetical protein
MMDDSRVQGDTLAGGSIGFPRHVAVDDQCVRDVSRMFFICLRPWIKGDSQHLPSNVLHYKRKDAVLWFAFDVRPSQAMLLQYAVAVARNAIIIPAEGGNRDLRFFGFLVDDGPVFVRDARRIAVQQFIVANRGVVWLHVVKS